MRWTMASASGVGLRGGEDARLGVEAFRGVDALLPGHVQQLLVALVWARVLDLVRLGGARRCAGEDELAHEAGVGDGKVERDRAAPRKADDMGRRKVQLLDHGGEVVVVAVGLSAGERGSPEAAGVVAKGVEAA